MNFSILRLLSGCFFLPLLCAACNSSARPTVQGTVTYQGQPVGNQVLTLHMKADQQANSSFHRVPLQPDGTFQGDAPAPGTYRVVIDPPLAALEGKGPANLLRIPQKYRDVATTPLTWTIEKGQNKMDIILTD